MAPVVAPPPTNINTILDAINSALSVVKSVADTPGINLIPYVSTVSSIIGALQTAEELGKDIMPYITALKDSIGGAVTTQAEVDALDAQIAALRARVEADLPPIEPGEPE